MKHYFKYAAIIAGIFLWFRIIGPAIFDGVPFGVPFVLVVTIFVIAPLLWLTIRSDVKKMSKEF